MRLPAAPLTINEDALRQDALVPHPLVRDPVDLEHFSLESGLVPRQNRTGPGGAACFGVNSNRRNNRAFSACKRAVRARRLVTSSASSVASADWRSLSTQHTVEWDPHAVRSPAAALVQRSSSGTAEMQARANTWASVRPRDLLSDFWPACGQRSQV